MSKIWNALRYAGQTKEDYIKVRPEIDEANRKTIFIFSIIALVFVTTMLVSSFFDSLMVASRFVYLFAMVISVLQIILSHTVYKRNDLMLNLGIQLAVFTFCAYGIMIGVYTRPDSQTVTFMIMLIFLPLLFIDKPWKMAITMMVYMAIFIVLASMVKTGDLLKVDITDTLIYGFLGICSGTVVICTKVRSYVLESRLEYQSRTDMLTGVYNRNCYEWKLEEYPDNVDKNLFCIYVDVNGLHELNNTVGHKAGDDMLRTVANDVKGLFGESDTYRIGGDEFVAFMLDSNRDKVNAMIESLEMTVESQGYHVAVGCEMQKKDNINMKGLITNAESKMYASKAEYYRKNDRRQR